MTYQPRVDLTAQVHPMAWVDETAFVGPRSRVRQFAFIVRGASIGADVSFGPGSGIDGSRCGDRCVFAQNVAAGPGYLIGNDCFLGPNVVLANDLFPQASRAGFDMEELLSGDLPCGVIEDGASVGANAVILPGVRVGRGAMVGALSLVHRDVPPATLWTRDGSLMPITDRMRRRRMRFVNEC